MRAAGSHNPAAIGWAAQHIHRETLGARMIVLPTGHCMVG